MIKLVTSFLFVYSICMDYINYYNSPLGKITLSSDGEALIGLYFEGGRYFCETLGKEYEEKDLPIFHETKKWLDIYFNGDIPDFTPVISLRVNEFRKSVCDILTTIPYGTVITYGDIAKKIAKQRGLSRMSSQAVGGAVGHNPISIIIPCHRVIGSNGNLTGFGGGIERKIGLLEIEKVDTSKMFLPKSK